MTPADDWGVYVHIPFCQARCTYCDFNTVTGMDESDHRRYVDALVAEWERCNPLAGRLASIYFGGGTPSLLDPALIGRVISAILARPGVCASDVEITVETNPGTVTLARLRHLADLGVNRLSIGAQALQDHHLTALNRIHDRAAIDETVAMARQAGFSNISLDAIYGIPNHTMTEWQETVNGLLALSPEHLSFYSLIVEEGTPLKRAVERRQAVLPADDLVADMADWAVARLRGAGLMPYEISNFARPGYESRHNQLYWQMEPYLALGAGAHAYAASRRTWNVRGVRRYMEIVEQGGIPQAGGEDLAPEEEMREFVWLGLRQHRGVDSARFARRYGISPQQAFASVLASLADKELVLVSKDALVLTERGRDLANVVARALVDAPVTMAQVDRGHERTSTAVRLE
jgi:oxygen-independent coproporphyrinogen-3 oxidase